jgi:hypothetical protein
MAVLFILKKGFCREGGKKFMKEVNLFYRLPAFPANSLFTIHFYSG